MNWPHRNQDDLPDTPSSSTDSISPRGEKRTARARVTRCFALDRETYTSGQAARILGIPARTLRRYLSIGKIEGVQNPITQTWQIGVEALARFIKAQGGEAIIAEQELVVLVIDGKPQVAELLRRFTSQHYPFWVVKAFQEVGDALIESGVQPPDLIIIDANTPFYDGVALLKLLRSNAHTASSKILAITDESDATKELDALGATTTLVKPFSFNDLAQTILYMFPTSRELPS